ncbi:MAG: transcription elongation factor GreA [Actinomycetota bacterium]|nr:transcription elongation factor GreA [Actinomycetota bacterium]
MKEYRLTREGYEKLKKEKEDLINNKRKEIAERLKEAKNLGGDLTENSEYDDAKNEQAFIEGRIKQIDDILNNCVIIDRKSNKGIVDLGSVVVVEDVDKKSKKEFKIVSSIESSPEENKISDESPIGMALIGKKTGEEVIVRTPTDTRRFKIISIK